MSYRYGWLSARSYENYDGIFAMAVFEGLLLELGTHPGSGICVRPGRTRQGALTVEPPGSVLDHFFHSRWQSCEFVVPRDNSRKIHSIHTRIDFQRFT